EHSSRLLIKKMSVSQPCLTQRCSSATSVELVATLDEPGLSHGRLLRDIPDEVSWLQVRADCTGDIPVSRLRQEFNGKLLYSLESAASPTASSGADQDRRRRLIAAASEGYDLVELDHERDIHADVLDAIRPEQRLVSWRGTATNASELISQF